MVTTIKISDDILPEVNDIVKEFGFDTKEDFVQEAIQDKVLELRKKIFLRGSDQIAGSLKKQRILPFKK